MILQTENAQDAARLAKDLLTAAGDNPSRVRTSTQGSRVAFEVDDDLARAVGRGPDEPAPEQPPAEQAPADPPADPPADAPVDAPVEPAAPAEDPVAGDTPEDPAKPARKAAKGK